MSGNDERDYYKDHAEARSQREFVVVEAYTGSNEQSVVPHLTLDAAKAFRAELDTAIAQVEEFFAQLEAERKSFTDPT